jgi:hypothetical protein
LASDNGSHMSTCSDVHQQQERCGSPYSTSAPSKFGQYWQQHQRQEQQERPHDAAPIASATMCVSSVRFSMPPLGNRSESDDDKAISALAPPKPLIPTLPPTFSASSFSQWLNGTLNISQQQQQQQQHLTTFAPRTPMLQQQEQQEQEEEQQQGVLVTAAPAATGAETPAGEPTNLPPPKPLVKRCSSMGSELWRGFSSSEDLHTLANMDASIDEIFGSLGSDTETVLHSVGLEVASDGSLRHEASASSVSASRLGAFAGITAA